MGQPACAEFKLSLKCEKSDRDLYEQLNKLDALRKSGVLTVQEFDAQKRKLLSHDMMQGGKQDCGEGG
jgi:Short C-terminal domain